MEKVLIEQLIVVTDGRSNVGGSPMTAAKEAASKGVIVNAIGIMNNDHGEDDSLYEVQKIAEAGGGIWENTIIKNLGHTMYAVTQKTVNKTIETMVGKKLKEIMDTELEDIVPQARNKIIEYIDLLSEEAEIRCCIAMDCSSSMNNKMSSAKQSVIELMNSLKGRVGKSEVAVIAYPGQNGEPTRIVSDFTQELDMIKDKILTLKAGGMTPTAAAINDSMSLIKGEHELTLDEIVREDEGLLKKSIV
ncbi:VWA domain-containing protein [Lutibacter sp. B2]|nr:VWA domain-containing protein [Lutibacter sp. B2]